MKICIISDAPNAGDPIVSMLESRNINIVEKESSSANPEHYKEVIADTLEKGNFDNILFVCNDPMQASIELNRNPDIRAAMCTSVRDISAARKNNANVIIIDANADAANIVDALVPAQEYKQKAPGMFKVKKKPEAKKIIDTVGGTDNNSGAGSANKVVNTPKVEDEEEPEENVKTKGIIGRIKYALGIENENSEDEENAKEGS